MALCGSLMSDFYQPNPTIRSKWWFAKLLCKQVSQYVWIQRIFKGTNNTQQSATWYSAFTSLLSYCDIDIGPNPRTDARTRKFMVEYFTKIHKNITWYFIRLQQCKFAAIKEDFTNTIINLPHFVPLRIYLLPLVVMRKRSAVYLVHLKI